MLLTAEDRQRLELFCKRADSIAALSIYREDRLSVGINMSWEKGGPLKLQQQGPSNAELLPMVTIVRQLYAQKESIQFNRIYNLVYQLIASSGTASDVTLENVKSAQSGFKQITSQQQLGLRLGGEKLTPTRIVDIWFNGNIFHADPSKSKTYDELWNSPMGSIADFCFRSTVTHLATLFVYFGGLIRAEILGVNKT